MDSPISPLQLAAEVSQRRTFAIISHPDAGKTTLTEKLLLYSGMLRTAGMVRARKGGKATSSDWMAMEQERGISISASAMQFRYKDAVINVLDTPGHQDFSEDTYRTLTAADSAVMVIDAAKGVEAQTRKLFSVCRMRGIPILTVINKMDLPAREPLDLIAEVEQALGIHGVPMTWPLGSGKEFEGVVDFEKAEVLLFQRSSMGGAQKAQMSNIGLADYLSSHPRAESLRSEIELIEHAGERFDAQKFLRGEITPVFFASALTNFGVEPFFDSFVRLSPAPRSYRAVLDGGEEKEVDPVHEPFSGFVFKIQANMNPKHRDSMAYLRVCSGVFERDMVVKHVRSGREVRLSRSFSMLAQDRNTTDTAFPGDIVGVINPGLYAIGDTLSLTAGFNYPPIPQFPPEVVGQIRPLDVMRHKAFEKGLSQLTLEGAVQILRPLENLESSPLVAAVGKLQFEVLQYRLEDEYGVRTQLELMPFRYSAYLEGDPKTLRRPSSSLLAIDSRGRVVMLFASEWEKNFTLERNPDHRLVDFMN